jgi:hypothetical protein
MMETHAKFLDLGLLTRPLLIVIGEKKAQMLHSLQKHS